VLLGSAPQLNVMSPKFQHYTPDLEKQEKQHSEKCVRKRPSQVRGAMN